MTGGYPPSTAGVPWATGQPSGGNGDNCVEMSGQAELDDLICSTPRPYYCECDPFPNDPTNSGLPITE